MQVDSVLLGPGMWTAKTLRQMLGDPLLTKERIVDPHVG